MDATIWLGWIGVALAVGLLAQLWKRRSFLLWAGIALMLYAIIQDPPLAACGGGSRDGAHGETTYVSMPPG